MVIKYDTCSFSDFKIAPGHGKKFVEKNGKTHTFINNKNSRLFYHSKKPLNIRWTLKWRAYHKKGKVEETKKRIQRQKKTNQVKAIVGLSMDDINKIKEEMKNDKLSDAVRNKYAQEIKEKKKKYLEKVRKSRPAQTQDKKAMKVGKNIKRGKN